MFSRRCHSARACEMVVAMTASAISAVESDRQRPFHDLPQGHFITIIREFDQHCPWAGLVDRRAGPGMCRRTNSIWHGRSVRNCSAHCRRGLEVSQQFNRERG